MSTRNLEKLHIYGMFALGKDFGPANEMEHTPLNITLELKVLHQSVRVDI